MGHSLLLVKSILTLVCTRFYINILIHNVIDDGFLSLIEWCKGTWDTFRTCYCAYLIIYFSLSIFSICLCSQYYLACLKTNRMIAFGIIVTTIFVVEKEILWLVIIFFVSSRLSISSSFFFLSSLTKKKPNLIIYSSLSSSFVNRHSFFSFFPWI